MEKMSAYCFQRLYVHNATDKMVANLVGVDVNIYQDWVMERENLLSVYGKIEELYHSLNEEEYITLIHELNELKEENRIYEMKCNIERFKNIQERFEVTRYEFIDMLEYVGIKPPKALNELESIRNDGTMAVYTGTKSKLNTILNTYNKFMKKLNE